MLFGGGEKMVRTVVHICGCLVSAHVWWFSIRIRHFIFSAMRGPSFAICCAMCSKTSTDTVRSDSDDSFHLLVAYRSDDIRSTKMFRHKPLSLLNYLSTRRRGEPEQIWGGPSFRWEHSWVTARISWLSVIRWAVKTLAVIPSAEICDSTPQLLSLQTFSWDVETPLIRGVPRNYHTLREFPLVPVSIKSWLVLKSWPFISSKE